MNGSSRTLKLPEVESVQYERNFITTAVCELRLPFERSTDGRWVLSETRGTDGRPEIETPGSILELSEVYERIV